LSSNKGNKYHLHNLVPYGLLITRTWLLDKGILRHSLDNLVKRRELEPVAHGVYKRPETDLTWKGVVTSLQYMGQNLIVGGVTALELQGLTHYLPMSNNRVIHLYGYSSLPPWVKKLCLVEKFQWRGNSRLWGKKQESKSETTSTIPMYWLENSRTFKISSPEQAICEILADVPNNLSFEHAGNLMEGLLHLSPTRLQIVLENFKHVKAKRLMLWFAERQHHPWFNRLALEKIDLGSGKRVVVKHGKLDKKYQITVPAELYG
jgi:hypothetical protein